MLIRYSALNYDYVLRINDYAKKNNIKYINCETN